MHHSAGNMSTLSVLPKSACLPSQCQELTGKLPPEYPLEPGERLQPVQRRSAPAHRLPTGYKSEVSGELREEA